MAELMKQTGRPFRIGTVLDRPSAQLTRPNAPEETRMGNAPTIAGTSRTGRHKWHAGQIVRAEGFRELPSGTIRPYPGHHGHTPHQPSIEARDRSIVRCLAIGQIERHLVNIAPAPTFRRIIALNDRMPAGMEMTRGMFVR